MFQKLKEVIVGDETYTMETGFAGDMVLKIESPKFDREIEFRNVGDGNPDHMLQFIIRDTGKDGEELRMINFSLPSELSEIFLNHLSKPWKI